MPRLNDLSNLVFRGDPRRDDTFSLAMQTVARHFGKPDDYDKLYVVSGNAFAPDIRPGEPEKACWHVQGRGRNLDLVCACLGLTFRPVVYSPQPGGIPPQPEISEALAQWQKLYWRQPIVGMIRQTIAHGGLVLSMGEWSSPDLLRTEWGLILSASHEGDMAGSASNDRWDNAIDFVRDGWLINAAPGGSTLSNGALEMEILRRASNRIAGVGEMPLEPGPRKIIFGLAAMDAWITAMGREPFCGQCGQDSYRCAANTAAATINGSRTAARYLLALADRVQSDAAGHLIASAENYEAIVKLLTPALQDDGPESYREFMGDAQRQTRHAETVLDLVKTELAAAGAGIDGALLTISA